MRRFLAFLSLWAFLWACAPLPEPLPLPFVHSGAATGISTVTNRQQFAPVRPKNTPVAVPVEADAINLRASPELGHISSNVIGWSLHPDTMIFLGECRYEVDADGNLLRLWIKVQAGDLIGWVVAKTATHKYLEFKENLCNE